MAVLLTGFISFAKDKTESVLPAPSSGKAIVCIYRTVHFTGSSSHDEIYVNGKHRQTPQHEYEFTEVEPGTVVIAGFPKEYYGSVTMSAMAAANQARQKTREPAFNVPAKWIAPNLRDRALAVGYAVVDQTSVLATHLAEVIKQHAHALLTRQETKRLLDALAESQPKLVEELVPKLLSLGEVQKVLQQLLREQVSIRDLVTILETLLDTASLNKNPVLLVETARQALGRALVQPLLGDDGKLTVIQLDTAAAALASSAVCAASLRASACSASVCLCSARARREVASFSAREARTASVVLAITPSTSTRKTAASPSTNGLRRRANFCNWYCAARRNRRRVSGATIDRRFGSEPYNVQFGDVGAPSSISLQHRRR